MWQTNAIQIRDIPSVDCIRRTLKLLTTRYQNQYSPCMKSQFGWEVFLTTIFLEVVVRLCLGRIHWDASKEESGWADWFGQSSGFSNRSAVCILAGPWEVCRLQLWWALPLDVMSNLRLFHRWRWLWGLLLLWIVSVMIAAPWQHWTLRASLTQADFLLEIHD